MVNPAQGFIKWTRHGRPIDGSDVASVIMNAWAPRALVVAIDAFATHLRPEGGDAWYSTVNEVSGYSGNAWASADVVSGAFNITDLRRGSRNQEATGALIGAHYAIYPNAYYGGVIERAWSRFDAAGAIRKRGVKP